MILVNINSVTNYMYRPVISPLYIFVRIFFTYNYKFKKTTETNVFVNLGFRNNPDLTNSTLNVTS